MMMMMMTVMPCRCVSSVAAGIVLVVFTVVRSTVLSRESNKVREVTTNDTGISISMGQELAEPCNSYQVLNDEWRNPDANALPVHCDAFAAGWYALQIDKDPAIVPTLCLQDNTCGARVPLHVDMGNQPTPRVGENVTASLCGSFNVLGAVDCCVQRQSVTIKRCRHDIYIYRLKPQQRCPVALCAIRIGGVVSEQFTAKDGDVPRSIRADTSPTSDGPTSATTTTVGMIFREICPEGLPMCPDGTCGPCPSTAAPTTPVVTSPPSTTSQEITRTLGTEIIHTSPSPSPSPPPSRPTSTTTKDDSVSPFPSSSPLPFNVDDFVDAAHSSNSSTTANDTSDASEVAADSSKNESQSSSANSSIHDQIINSRENVSKDGRAGSSQSPDAVGFLANGTTPTTSENNMAPLSGNFTSGLNDSAEEAKPEPSGGDAVTPEVKPSSTADNGGTTATTLSAVSSTEVKDLSSRGPTPAGSTSPGERSTRSDEAMVTVAPVAEPPGLSGAVRFVLNGTYEEAEFRDALLWFMNNVSLQLTDGEVDVGRGLHNLTLLAQTSSLPSHITVVDVLVDDPNNNGTIPSQRFVTIIKNENFAETLLLRTGLTLIQVCPTADLCDVAPGDGDSVSGGPAGYQSLFDRNRGIFIAVIAVAASCLLALLVGLLLLHYRRRGVWVLAPDQEEKAGEPLAVENPMTDQQILNGEGQGCRRESETTLTINGTDPHHSYSTATPTPISSGGGGVDSHNGHGQWGDIPAADEDNGWVVPLDQAPLASTSFGMAERTEDTQF